MVIACQVLASSLSALENCTRELEHTDLPSKMQNQFRKCGDDLKNAATKCSEVGAVDQTLVQLVQELPGVQKDLVRRAAKLSKMIGAMVKSP